MSTTSASSGEGGRPRRIRRLVETALLMRLYHEPAHGYGLMTALKTMGLEGYPMDSSAMYRVLRELERNGAVTSAWHIESSAGPPRRVLDVHVAPLDAIQHLVIEPPPPVICEVLRYAGLGQLTDMRWDNRFLVRSMHEATIAIWGYGDISQRLIALLRPLQPKEILLHSGHLTPEQAAQVGVTLVSFDELFERGDIIHLLGAMTDRNAGKVGPKQLAAIRDNAVLINAGRARLVQEEALLAEVRKQRFLTILDVHYKEHVPADSPFRGMPNVILTPHVAGRGKEGLYIPHVLEEFDRFFRGEPLISEVTQERALGMTDESKAHKRT